MDQSKEASASAIMGDIMSYMIGVKSAEASVNDAKRTVCNTFTVTQSSLRLLSPYTSLPRERGMKLELFFIFPRISRISDNAVFVRNGKLIETHKAPVPVGRSDSRLRTVDYEAGVTYMGEKQADYQTKVPLPKAVSDVPYPACSCATLYLLHLNCLLSVPHLQHVFPILT